MRKKEVLGKLLFIFCILIFLGTPLFSDSFTFDTGIYGISFGPNNFGMNLFPAGTHFGYYHYFVMYDEAKYYARVNVDTEFRFETAYIPGLYNAETGVPIYLLKEGDVSLEEYISGAYFNPNAYINFYLEQPFGFKLGGDNDWVFILRGGFRTRYYMALENLNVGILGDVDSLLFVDPTGSSLYPFGKDSYVRAYPWLSGNRDTWNTYLYLYTYFDFREKRALEAYDGLYAEIMAEYGPFWLMNNITPKFTTSDFYRFRGYLEESLTLYALEQENGFNWINVQLIHSNRVEHIGGSVIPQELIPTDRLSTSVNDRLSLRFTGPQFIASDCYATVELSLDNNVYFGRVVNQSSKGEFIWEAQSKVRLYFLLKLFGFIRLDYTIEYKFFNGIWPSYPAFSQDASVRFYVSI